MTGRACRCAGRVRGERALRQRVHESGVQPAARREVWKFLLGFYPMGSSATERAALLAGKRAEYGRLKEQWRSISKAQAARCASCWLFAHTWLY